jgi:Ran GTPase-activating protein (RanGAP) involved in mRNA processing and transport
MQVHWANGFTNHFIPHFHATININCKNLHAETECCNSINNNMNSSTPKDVDQLLEMISGRKDLSFPLLPQLTCETRQLILESCTNIQSLVLCFPEEDELYTEYRRDGTNLVEMEYSYLPEALIRMRELQDLSIVASPSTPWTKIFQGTSSSNSITKLHLSGSTTSAEVEGEINVEDLQILSRDACHALGSMLEATVTLETLVLTGFVLGDISSLDRGLLKSRTIKFLEWSRVVGLPKYLPANLERLHIFECDLSSYPPLMLHCPKLQHLRLCGCTALTAETIACLTRLRSLLSLDLGQNRIDAETAQAVASFLCQCQHLEKLNLDYTQLNNEGLTAISAGLRGTHQLRKLSLRVNSITNVECIAKNLAQIQDLNLWGNRSLDLQNAATIQQLLDFGSPLKRLDLAMCTLTQESIVAICRGLRHSSLEYLNLACNKNIGSDIESVSAMTLMLQVNGSLQSLELYSCCLGDEGITKICSSLATSDCSALQRLGLNLNDIGNDGADHLAKLLRVNRVLKTLDLDFNKFDHTGLSTLTLAVKEANCWLIELRVTVYTASAAPVKQELSHFLLLNRSGRCKLLEDRVDETALVHAGCVYGENGLYFLLRQTPQLFLR